MKRIFLLVACAILVFCLTACGSEDAIIGDDNHIAQEESEERNATAQETNRQEELPQYDSWEELLDKTLNRDYLYVESTENGERVIGAVFETLAVDDLADLNILMLQMAACGSYLTISESFGLDSIDGLVFFIPDQFAVALIPSGMLYISELHIDKNCNSEDIFNIQDAYNDVFADVDINNITSQYHDIKNNQ